jgi:nicotinamide riboside transporter PnuC
MLIEILGTIAGAIAVVGVILNNRKSTLCFKLWFVSNGLSFYIHLISGLYSMAFRDFVFIVLAFDGLRRWRTP